MSTTASFNQSALQRAKDELCVFQSNVIVQTDNGSELRGVWEGHRFVDYSFGDPIEGIQDFWIEDRFPDCPGILFS